MKANLLWSKGLIAVLFAAACVTVTFGQSDRAKNDLFRSFKKFDLQKVTEHPRMANGHRSLVLKAAGGNVTIEVEPHDIRSARYRSEDSASPGFRKPA
ncbi:MAG TPA: hypothetical protein VEV84_00800, partial [Pyrinomonadaceae bacterium]|nr:hypothetical protein [Pyrinomonadaceae bacterium]